MITQKQIDYNVVKSNLRHLKPLTLRTVWHWEVRCCMERPHGTSQSQWSGRTWGGIPPPPAPAMGPAIPRAFNPLCTLPQKEEKNVSVFIWSKLCEIMGGLTMLIPRFQTGGCAHVKELMSKNHFLCQELPYGCTFMWLDCELCNCASQCEHLFTQLWILFSTDMTWFLSSGDLSVESFEFVFNLVGRERKVLGERGE